MTDTTILWGRVELSEDLLIRSYMVFTSKTLPSGDLCSTNLGGATYVPPVPMADIPVCIADPLRIMVMRRRTLEGFGVWVERKYDNFRNGDDPVVVVWMYHIPANVEDFSNLSRSKSWEYAPTAGQKVYKEILDKLTSHDCTEASS